MAISDTQRRRLKSLLAETDKVFRDAFDRYVKTVKSKRVMDAIIEQLEARNPEGAIGIIRAQTNIMGSAVPEAFQIAGKAAISEASAQINTPSLGGFDPTHPQAAAIMRGETLGLIREFTQKQIESVRDALAQGLANGEGAIATARRIRNVIGLTRTQAAAVQRYSEQLRSGVAAEQRAALQRDIRDRRFDRTVQRAIREKRPLSADETRRMVDQYRARYLQYRAEMIARTESTRVTSLAREEAFRQTSEQAGIGGNRMIRVWNATHDSRTREWHADMDQQERAPGASFVDGKGNRLMFPGDPSAPADTIINCRCVLTMRIAAP